MNEFVEQCRREWKRLRIPNPVADDMAAELAADLKDAEAEGVSEEELLGNDLTDPRSFAAAWAHERAIIPRPGSTARLPGQSLVLAAGAALTITAVGAALVLFASPPASATRAAIGVLPGSAAAPTPVRVSALPPTSPFTGRLSPDGSATVWVGRDGRLMLTQAGGSGVEIHDVGSILLIVGIVGVIASLFVLFWSSRTSNDWSGRGRRVGDVPPGPG